MHTFHLIFFRALLQAALVGKTGNSFQEFFVAIARKKWGSDFETIRPYGNLGDRKCDGKISSEGRFFQCYAPYGAVELKVHQKIRGDFEGALAKWNGAIKRWTFVINDREGLDAASDAKVEELRRDFPDINFDVFGPHEFEELVFQMREQQLADIFAVSLAELDPRRWSISFEEIASVIRALDLTDPAADDSDMRPPPLDKVRINRLSSDVAEIIRKSDVGTKDVERYFRSVPAVDLEARVAATLSGIYRGLKSEGDPPDAIFYKLLGALDLFSVDQKFRVAGFALVTHFFRSCVIFEETETAV